MFVVSPCSVERFGRLIGVVRGPPADVDRISTPGGIAVQRFPNCLIRLSAYRFHVPVDADGAVSFTAGCD